LVGSAINVRNGSQTSTLASLQGVVVDAPCGKYYLVNSDNSTVNQILVSDVAGGAPTVLYCAPNVVDYQFSGLAIDQSNHTLYLAQNSTTAAQRGIHKVDEITGVATAAVVGHGIRSPDCCSSTSHGFPNHTIRSGIANAQSAN
jgi:hypothetical protein